MTTETGIAGELARAAKELLSGMQFRVHRDPDVADFAVTFDKILDKHLPDVRRSIETAAYAACRNALRRAATERGAAFAYVFFEEYLKQPNAPRDYQTIADNLLGSLKLYEGGNQRKWLKGWLQNFTYGQSELMTVTQHGVLPDLGAAPRCAKCGVTDIYTLYHRSHAPISFDWENDGCNKTSDGAPSGKEHLLRRCRHCQYQWRDGVVEAKP